MYSRPRALPYIDDDDDDDDHSPPAKQTNGAGWFYVNKDGFPMTDKTWDRMWKFAGKLHPIGPSIGVEIRRSATLPEIPVPHAPLNQPVNSSLTNKLDAVQKYLSQLQYNHTGTQFFDIKKNRPFCGLMDCARDMIRDSLPIKCLEAVVLSIYLTNFFPGLDRFPVSFNSVSHGNVHRHVILCVHANGKYGALGMSRRDDLMYKSLTYDHLSDLIMDYNNCYKKYGHTLKKVKIGMCAPHDPHTYEMMQWGVYSIDIQKVSLDEWRKEIDRFSRQIKKQSTRWQSAPGNFYAVPKPPPIPAATSLLKGHRKSQITLDLPKKTTTTTLNKNLESSSGEIKKDEK